MDARPFDRVIDEQARRAAQRREGVVEHAGRLAGHAERDEHVCPVARSHTSEAVSRAKRELIERGRLDVRADGASPVAAEPRVLPCLLVATCRREMQGKRRRVRVERDGVGLDRLSDAPVQLATAPEREAFIGDLADERVPEAQHARRVTLDKPTQSRPQRLVEHNLVFQRSRQQLRTERYAEHGRVPEHCPIGRRELVDVRRHGDFDRVRQRFCRPRRARDIQ